MTEIIAKAYFKPKSGISGGFEFSLGDKPNYTDVSNLGITEKMAQARHYSIPVNKTINVTDHTTSGAQGDLKLITLQEGLWLILGATCDLALTAGSGGIADGAAVLASIGSVVPGTDTTLTSTEANVIPSTAATLSSGAGHFRGASTGVAFLDGTATPASLYLNFDVPDADSSADDTLAISGTIEVFALHLGDHA